MKPKVGPKKGMVKKMRGGGMAAKPKVGPKKMRSGGAVKKMRSGGMAKKEVPEENKGLAKLPKNVRNKMGFMANGGAVKPKVGPKKMAKGGAVKPKVGPKKRAKGGAAVRSSSSKSL
tara:strand:- start:2921 stop:3271 length:351 start_codon:yes stop_codon:yes gene_type:complete